MRSPLRSIPLRSIPLLLGAAVFVAAGCTDQEMASVFDTDQGDIVVGDTPVPEELPGPVECAAPVSIVYHQELEPYRAVGDLEAAAGVLAGGLGGRPVVITTEPTDDSVVVIDVRWTTTLDPASLLGQATSTVGYSDIELNAQASLDTGPVPGGFQVLFLHELGHAVGLDHVDDPAAVMNPTLGSGVEAVWGVDELRGLEASPYACG